jgi:hypothetical protein
MSSTTPAARDRRSSAPLIAKLEFGIDAIIAAEREKVKE